jgi:hypothetical protein
MRRIVFVLAVVFMVGTPARAEVLITCVDQADEANVVISFDNSEGQHVRGFALDIMVDGGTITAVECLSSDYYIYPGSIQISDNEVTSFGTCVCDVGLHPDTLPGLDTNGVTIEMAAAYSPNDPEHNIPPADSGDLVKITIDHNTSPSVLCSSYYFGITVAIRANGIRGGVVMEDASTVEPNAPGCGSDVTYIPCMASGHPDYAEWQNVCEPNCWCYPRQCHGDMDCAQEYGTYWVLLNDLNDFKDCFGLTGIGCGHECLCADFAHDTEYGTYRVLLNDLNIFKTYFGSTSVPCCDADQDCDPTNDSYFNCWMCPP